MIAEAAATADVLQLAAFLVTALVAVGAALIVVVHRNPVVNAVALILNLGCIAVFFLLLRAPFLAAIQVIVYAGAIMVLFLFVIMLLDLRVEMRRLRGGGFQRFMAVFGGGGFLLLIFMALRRSRGTVALDPARAAFGSIEQVAITLFTDHLVSFELASVLLLVAMVGALVLARSFFDPSEGGR